MVVLDVINAAAREAQGKIRELRRRQTLRLERGAGQSPRRRAHPAPQLMQPVTGATEGFDQLLRKHDIVQRHVLVQRGVAEQHVDELPGIAADGFGGERDANFEQPMFFFGDALDPADDLGAHEVVHDRRQRHLDALLDRDGACTRLDRSGVAAGVVDRLQTWGHGAL